MEKVTDERGRTFTKQADIMNVQRDFFPTLYKKINKEGMEEKNNYFYEKHNNPNDLCSTER